MLVNFVLISSALIAGLFVLISALSVVACAFVSKRIEKTYYYVLVTDVNTLLAVCTGIAVFLFFRNLRMKPNRVINAIAATVFGVTARRNGVRWS